MSVIPQQIPLLSRVDVHWWIQVQNIISFNGALFNGDAMRGNKTE